MLIMLLAVRVINVTFYLFSGHMQYLYDLDGNRYLDMIAGIATVIAGHCHPKIQEVSLFVAWRYRKRQPSSLG